jgi:lipopolysaccharide biosynthesis regulator YciM
MGKLSVFIFVLFLVALSIFAVHNKEVTTVTIPFDAVYEIPKIALILFSSAAGALAMLIVFAIRDTKKFIDNWQFQKKQKQDTKVQELYSKALNSILAHNEDGAKEALAEVLSEEPEHIGALQRLGDIYTSEGDYQKANSYYQKAKAISPENLETLFAIENVLEKTGRWADALQSIEEILDLDDANLTAMYRKRNILEKQGRWDDLVYLQKTILKHEHTEKDKKREHENLIGYKYEYGRDSLENNQLEKAKKAFKTVLRLDREFIPATLGMAEAMFREGDSEEAINLLEKTYEETSSKVVLARLEDLLISLGEPSRLISIYKNSILRNPNEPSTKFFLGKLFYRLEMIDDAFETLYGMDTGGAPYPELHRLLGNLYLRRNQFEKAVEEFKKGVDGRMSMRLPYCCSACGFAAADWSGRCPDCKQWGTYQFNLVGVCKA